MLTTGQVNAIDRRWFGQPDTRITRRDFQLPEVGTIYSASTYEEDGTMTVAGYEGVLKNGLTVTRRMVHTCVFNHNITIGTLRSVARFFHRSVDVTDADDTGKTAGKQVSSKWDTKSIPELYGVPSAGSAYANASGWWDVRVPCNFYFGEPTHDRDGAITVQAFMYSVKSFGVDHF